MPVLTAMRLVSFVNLRSTDARGDEFALHRPRRAIGLQGISEPTERIGRDLDEAPTCRRAVGARPELDDVRADPPADLLLVVVPGRIAPLDAPRAERRIPEPQRGAVHVAIARHARMPGRALGA